MLMLYNPEAKGNNCTEYFLSNLLCLPMIDKRIFASVQLSTDKTVKVLNILEKNIQDGSKLSTLLNHVSLKSVLLILLY